MKSKGQAEEKQNLDPLAVIHLMSKYVLTKYNSIKLKIITIV